MFENTIIRQSWAYYMSVETTFNLFIVMHTWVHTLVACIFPFLSLRFFIPRCQVVSMDITKHVLYVLHIVVPGSSKAIITF